MRAQESRDTQKREAVKGPVNAKYNTEAGERRVGGWLSGRSREVFAVVSVLLVALGFGLASARPAAADSWPVVSKEMTISPQESQADTGIDLKVGDQLIVEANGWIDPDGHLWPWDPDIGPDGIADGRCYSSFPKPCAPRYSLLGKLAGPGYFFLGSNYNGSPWMAGTEQRLYLGVNDERLDDNAGIFSVRITVYRPLPDTTIESGPSGTVDTRSASFSFSSSKPGSTFECSLDYAAFGSCSSPKYYEGLSDGEHDFGVRAVDLDGHTGPTTWREWTVSVPPPSDTTPPWAPVISAPADGSYDTDGEVTISGAAEANISVELFDGAASQGTATVDASGWWTKTLTGLPDGAHQFTAKATDASGNVSDASRTTTVVVDSTAPAVASTLPASNDATGVSPAANVAARFSEGMRASTINANTVKLVKKGTNTKVPATVRYDELRRRVVLDPSVNLRSGATYTATVTNRATDLAGNALPASKVWTFTVR